MHKKTLILAIFFLFLVYARVFALQFEDFTWGKSSEEIKTMLEDKRKNFSSAGEERMLTYQDTILDEPCNVFLIFTPQSKVLAAVKIFWDAHYIGERLKAVLTNKYGQPFQQTKFIDEYLWFMSTKGEMLGLDYTFNGTKLYYYGGEYQKKYEKEEREIATKEAGIF